MYRSLYVILILINIIYNICGHSHCLTYLRHHQPSVGHYFLGIEHSIHNEHLCEHRCSINHRCSMATFNRYSHRCHLFQHNQRHLLSNPYRSNHMFSTFAHCPERSSLSNFAHPLESNVHCDYDLLPWQHAQRSVIFKSYTLIGASYVPCQELCTSIRYCAGVQYQIRGPERNRCQLLRSTKPWELESSKTWTVFAKRLCHVVISESELFFRNKNPLCYFKYFSQGQHKRSREIIHAFSHIPLTECEYVCSKLVNCIGIEFIERRSQCLLLSSNFLRNDGSLNIKYHRHHHIYMKMSCSISQPKTSISRCSLHDIHCNCHHNPCQHGTCLSRRSEGYQYMFCDCHHGYTGHLCDQSVTTELE